MHSDHSNDDKQPREQRCLKCDRVKPIEEFGVRTLTRKDGTETVRVQTWCRVCRGGTPKPY